MIDAVVVDIEGTTVPVAFVHERLFPYARTRMGTWLAEHASAPEVRAVVDDVRREAGLQGRGLAAVVDQLEAWMAADAKVTPLKTLQGWVWEDGYATGALRAPVYPDVVAALGRWRAHGWRVAVYSSGSVHAQQLLYGHTTAGDLRGAFDRWFDTTTGSKREPSSYVAICAALEVAPARTWFLSDLVHELDAAAAAGLQTTLIVRDGPRPADGRHAAARSLEGLLPPGIASSPDDTSR
ncbi:MAG: acireductone synthase [Alphaproteobacteria bacterium]|nr:acireductone synthase [Alphaproteobacteria bacterium]